MSKNDTNEPEKDKEELNEKIEKGTKKEVEQPKYTKHVCNYRYYSTPSSGSYYICKECGNVKITSSSGIWSNRN